jgi:hypothetical protein
MLQIHQFTIVLQKLIAIATMLKSFGDKSITVAGF